MLDHMGFAVKDYDRSKTFYEQALVPLGLSVVKDFPGAAAGSGKDGPAALWIKAQGRPVQGRLHTAFTADSHEGSFTPTTTARVSSIQTATTSRPSATSQTTTHEIALPPDGLVATSQFPCAVGLPPSVARGKRESHQGSTNGRSERRPGRLVLGSEPISMVEPSPNNQAWLLAPGFGE